MTLAFALRGSNGLVLGADSRMSSPEGTADTSTKFLQINREIGVLTYGLADVGFQTINRLHDEVNRSGTFTSGSNQRIVHFSEISKIAEDIMKETFALKLADIQKTNPEISPDHPALATGFILGGFDANETNQFKILHWSTPDFNSEERADVIAAQWHISQFLSDHFYYSEMDIEQLKRLAVFMLIETETVSASVGGQLRLATVTLEGGFQRLNENDIQSLICECQPRFAKYRSALLEKLRFE